MSSGENKVRRTQHAFLVAWGWFAEHIGLPDQFGHIPLKQKRYHHTPQTKVLEFFVSILGGDRDSTSWYLFGNYTILLPKSDANSIQRLIPENKSNPILVQAPRKLFG